MKKTGGPVPSNMTRATQKPNYPLLDGLRAVAALAVFAHHWAYLRPSSTLWHEIGVHGNAGVLLFFLISGFLLYRPMVAGRVTGKPIRLGEFYRRRALRIVPAYWVALTLLALWPGLPRFADRWWQLYLFGQGFDPGTIVAGIAPAWSLAVEVTFYLLLPLYGVLVARLRWRWGVDLAVLALLALASLGFKVWIGSTSVGEFGYTLPGTFYLFAVGMGLAVLTVHTPLLDVVQRLVRWPVLLVVAAAALFVVLSLTMTETELGSTHPLYVPVALLLLVATLTASRDVTVVLGGRALTAFGVVSYAFYLWHQDVLKIVASTPLPGWAVGVAALVVTTLIAAASYRWVESPFLRRKPAPSADGRPEKLDERGTAPPSVASGAAAGAATSSSATAAGDVAVGAVEPAGGARGTRGRRGDGERP